MTSTASRSLRQDIQQLRGIAVLAVIVNHLGVSWLPGGYLGVDMFFVVSGYVITLSMLSGGTSPVSRFHFFAQFWIRRMFRLWPMLFVTVIATTVMLLATGLANPDPLLTGLTSVLALSNFRLLFGRLEYFALDTGADWFMHTWSLAVEEQIYVMLSVVFALVGMRPTTPDATRRLRRLFAIVSVLVLISLAFAFLPITSEVVRFYAPHTRFYQVGAGALVALVLARRGFSLVALPNTLRSLLLLLSSAALAALFVINPWSGRTISFVATLLTVLIIVIASAEQQAHGYIRNGWLSYIGDRSYALYLVHWPVQVLSETLISERYSRYAASLAFTLVLGAAGYHFVENRSRHRWKSLRHRHAGALAFAALIVTLGVTVVAFERTDRVARSASTEVPDERCTREDASIWVIGDSHFTHAPLEPLLARETKEDCLLIGGYGIFMDLVWLDQESAGQREVRMRLTPTAWLIEQIRNASTPPQALVIVHFLSAFLSDPATAPASANFVATEWQSSTGESVTREEFIEQFGENLTQVAAALDERGGSLVVTSPPPDFDWLGVGEDPTLCANRIVVSRECAVLRSEARVSTAAHEARGGETRSLLDGLQRELPNFTHIRLDTPFCASEYCSNFSKGKLAYLDDDHLNLTGAGMLRDFFDEVTSRATPRMEP